MKLTYEIHSATQDKFPVKAEVAGRKVDAEIPGLVIEAVSADGSMGHTFRLTPDDMDAALEEFAPGNVLTVTLKGAPRD